MKIGSTFMNNQCKNPGNFIGFINFFLQLYIFTFTFWPFFVTCYNERTSVKLNTLNIISKDPY